MTGEEPCNLYHLPLHILSIVLTELDSIKSLHSAILSHRTCLAAFNDNRYSITVSIIRKQIPEDLLPFALALHESTKIDFDDIYLYDESWYDPDLMHPDLAPRDAVRDLLTRLAQGIPDPANVVSALQSMSVAASISESYATIEPLCQHFTRTSIPLLNNRLGLDHPQQASKQEIFRLGRAFYRYQLMCNLFCRAENEPDFQERYSRLFFQDFSLWVNEQLICVYAYLRGNLIKGESIAIYRYFSICRPKTKLSVCCSFR